jgi:hypothetical protein
MLSSSYFPTILDLWDTLYIPCYVLQAPCFEYMWLICNIFQNINHNKLIINNAHLQDFINLSFGSDETFSHNNS